MSRILCLKMAEDALEIQVRIHIESRLADPALGNALILEGIRSIQSQSPYLLGGRPVYVRVRVTQAPEFSLDAVNILLHDVTPVIRRKWFRFFNNGSREYPGSHHRGFYKLVRYLLKKPDLYINLGGRDISSPHAYELMRSVVEHEFGHVLGFKDKYRFRDNKKVRKDVDDEDIMYRTGSAKRFQEYHINRLCACAKRGRLPVKRV